MVEQIAYKQTPVESAVGLLHHYEGQISVPHRTRPLVPQPAMHSVSCQCLPCVPLPRNSYASETPTGGSIGIGVLRAQEKEILPAEKAMMCMAWGF